MGSVEADTERHYRELDKHYWLREQCEERIEFLMDDLEEVIQAINGDHAKVSELVFKVAAGNITEARDMLEEVAENIAIKELEHRA